MFHNSEYLIWAIQHDHRDEAERHRRTRACLAADPDAPRTGQPVRAPVLSVPAHGQGHDMTWYLMQR